MEIDDEILQIISTDGTYYVREKYYSGTWSNNLSERKYKVVCWALIKCREMTMVIPLVMGERALIALSRGGTWSISREVG